MPIIARAGADYLPAPEGTWSAVCVDVVDLGVVEVTFNARTEKKHMIRVVWQISENMDNGKPFCVSRRYKLSLHKKAALRATLEGWRGRAFTDAQLMGFDVEILIGVPCLVTVIHVVRDGQTFSNVSAVVRQPPAMPALKPREYVRVTDREHQETGSSDAAGDSIDED